MSRSPTPPRRTLVVSDNSVIARAVRAIVEREGWGDIVDLAHSPSALPAFASFAWSAPIDLKREAAAVASRYELVVSAHCKQMFPPALLLATECVNIHPGYNPETRGWFPQVWAIIHGHRLGVTVHRMDDKLDHGPIIDRQEVPVAIWDTSYTAYQRVVGHEIDWLEANFRHLLTGDYTTFQMESEGNLFKKNDFERLCALDLEETATFRTFYDRLRALSFAGYSNAYFRDPATGRKVFLELKVTIDPADQPEAPT